MRPALSKPVYRGLNLSGAEFTHDAAHLPGVVDWDYRYPTSEDIRYVANCGHRMVRLPIRWERVQPVLMNPLAGDEIQRLLHTIDQAAAVGLKVLIDIHNYARYIRSDKDGGAILVLGDGRLTNTHLVDLWSRLSSVLKGRAGLLGYGLMNEPHDLPEPAAQQNGPATTSIHLDTAHQHASATTPPPQARQWATATQLCVNAIRSNQDRTPVYVSGVAFSGAQNWPSNHPQPWVDDPAGAIIYEAHYYFDRDNSGAYRNSFADEDAEARSRGYASLKDRACTELGQFVSWCNRYGVKGFIGELGWENSRDTELWNSVGEALYTALDKAQIGAAYWAAGQWYGSSYNLSAYTGTPLSQRRAPAAVIEAHPTRPI